MPELIPDGPFIPDEITQALEDEELVLFCGAGVSIPAGYPSFSNLVQDVREQVPISNDRLVEVAIKNREYDRALGLIEKETNTGEVRRVVKEILSKKPKILEVHKSILELSSLKNGHVRFVTTNFDELFYEAAVRSNLSNILIDSAPKFPLAKPDRWNSLVHLHGRIKDEEVEIGRNWVLTSSDFGKAYITEGYCSRFVTELFRNFVVLFVGYGVNDPVMKYLIDALSVAIFRGENFNRAYAFAEYPKSANREDVEKEWESKGIKAIPYQIIDENNHCLLYKTLDKWAKIKQSGISSRAAIVLEKTKVEPQGINDPDVAQVVWALKEGTGKVAGKLADSKHDIPISWLPIFDDAGLLSMGRGSSFSKVHFGNDKEQKNNFNNLSTTHLVSFPQSQHGNLHPITYNLTRWLIKHLSTKELLYWVLNKGVVLHRQFRWLIHRTLENREKRPREPFLTIWRVLSSDSFQDLYTRHNQLANHGLIKGNDLLAKQELLQAVSLRPLLRPNKYYEIPPNGKDSISCKDVISVELEFVDQDIGYMLEDRMAAQENLQCLGNLAEPLTEKLVRSMEWLEILGFANEEVDPSIYQLPSISIHTQNKYAEEWTRVIELLRECFEALSQGNRARAESIAIYWSELKYPVFKRLALYAATELEGEWISRGVTLLLASNAQLLWSDCVSRESLRFLRKAASKLEQDEIKALCREIFRGEKIDFPSDSSDKTQGEKSNYSIWQRFKKLQVGGAKLPEEVISEIEKLEKQHEFVTDTENVDELPFYSPDAEFKNYKTPICDTEFDEVKLKSAKERLALLDSLKSNNRHTALWRRLVEEHPKDAIATLEEAAAQSIWDEYLWSSPLCYWQELNGQDPPITIIEGSQLLSLILSMPEYQRLKLALDIANWLGRATNFIDPPEGYLDLWDWCWTLAVKTDSGKQIIEPLTTALNHPTGRLTQGLLNKLLPKTIKFGEGISPSLQTRVEKILEIDSKENLGHIIVASRTFQLFFLDSSWFEKAILPLFSFENSERSVQCWEGYLWDSRMTPNLAKLLKNSLLKAIEKISSFSKHGRECLVHLFMMVSLDHDIISTKESKTKLDQMDPKQLHDAVDFIIRRSGSLGSMSGAYWVDTLKPWLKINWPRNKAKTTPEMSEVFSILALTTGEKFEDSVGWLKNAGLFCEAPKARRILRRIHPITETSEKEELHPTKFPEKFPAATFDLIDTLRPFRDDYNGTAKAILDRIAQVDPKLKVSPKFKKLYDQLP